MDRVMNMLYSKLSDCSKQILATEKLIESLNTESYRIEQELIVKDLRKFVDEIETAIKILKG